MLYSAVIPQLWISWPPGTRKFFHIHHTVLICTVGIPSLPKDGKAPQRSTLPLRWRCSKWSLNRCGDYVGKFSLYETEFQPHELLLLFLFYLNKKCGTLRFELLMYWTLDTTSLARTQRVAPPTPGDNLSCDRRFSTRHVLKNSEHVLLLSFMKLYCLSSFAVFALLAVVFKTRKSRACNCSLCPLHLESSTVGYARFVSCPLLLTLRSLTLYIYGAPILDVSRSHTTTQHSR